MTSSDEVEEKGRASSSSSPRGAGCAGMIMDSVPSLLQKKTHTPQKIKPCQPTSSHRLTLEGKFVCICKEMPFSRGSIEICAYTLLSVWANLHFSATGLALT